MIASYGETLLRISGIFLQYGEKVVLRNVSSEINDMTIPGRTTGQVVGILGPSGVGKTSLFRIIAGFERPTSGVVGIKNGGGMKPVTVGSVGVVSQSYTLFDNRTVIGNLLLAARHRENPTSAALEYLLKFNLGDHVHSYPVQLSGGQRQRVAIIQQILTGGHFLLMDEPFSGQDLVNLDEISHLIRQVADLDDLNIIIVISHDVTTLCSVADHVWMLGRDHEGGKPVPGAYIKKTYDLVAEDLCWHPDIVTDPKFMSFVAEVKQEFRNL